VLDRKIFDRALAKKAAIAGSDIQVKTHATGLIVEDKKIVGIKGISRGDQFEARSKVIIGADGVESKVGRWAGLLSPLRLKDIGSCAQFLLSGVDIDRDCLDFYLGNEICPGGYLWVFPKGDMMANVGLGISGTRFREMYAIEYLKKFVDEHFAGANIIQTMVGGVPVCDMNGRISTDGLMLAGDGARLVDPLMGAGIMNAMLSGRMAGKRAVDAIEKGDVSDRELRKYDAEVRECMGKAIHRNYLIKEFLVNASDRQINTLFGSLRRTNVESMPVTSLYKTATTKGLPIFKVMRALI
jgi:digeranylgeranylglycerophospholipid reductase